MSTILIVDDYAALLQMLAMTLEARGYQVIALTKPRDALLVATTGHDIDLVITDYTMPDMSGAELISEIRKRRPEMRILMLSGAEHAPCGEDAFISKTGSAWRKYLLQTVSDLLGESRECKSKTEPGDKKKRMKRCDISEAS